MSGGVPLLRASVALLVPSVTVAGPPPYCTGGFSLEYEQGISLQLGRWSPVGALRNNSPVEYCPCIDPAVIIAMCSWLSRSDDVKHVVSLVNKGEANLAG